MQVFLNLLEQLKQAKAGDKKSCYADILWQINDRMELILAHFDFSSDPDVSTPLFRESTDTRLSKVEERLRLQQNDPAAAFVDAVNGGINIIEQLLDDQFKVYTQTSFNMTRGVFEVSLGLNIWGTSSRGDTPSKQKAFHDLLEDLREEGFVIDTKEIHARLYDMTQNRSLMEAALDKMFHAKGIQYEIREDFINEIHFIVRPEDIPVPVEEKENLPSRLSDELDEDDVYQLMKEVNMAKSSLSMLTLDAKNQNLYLSTLRYNICNMEEIMGCEDLSICRDIKSEHRIEREKNLQIQALEKQAQVNSIGLLKDRNLMEKISTGFARFVRIQLAPLFLKEFTIQNWNVVEFTLGPNRMPLRGPYEGKLDCIQTEEGHMPAAIFTESQLRYIETLMQKALPSVELVSAEAVFRRRTSPLINQIKFRLNDPADFAELLRHLPPKDGQEDLDYV